MMKAGKGKCRRVVPGLFAVLTAVALFVLGCAHFGPLPDLPEGKQVYGSTGNYWYARYSETSGLNYLVTYPSGFDSDDAPEKGWPVIFFLHSLEERGMNIESLIDNPRGEGKGLPYFALEDSGFPFVTVAPACPGGTYWPMIHNRLDRLYDEVMTDLRLDRSKCFVTGVSMGGMGTWSWAMESPEIFAAAAPISAGIYVPPMKINFEAIIDLPMWAFHDRNDPSIPLDKEEGTVQKLKDAGGNIRYTITDTGNHYIHADIYRDGELFEWFLTH